MKCTNPNCRYEWNPRTKLPKSCPKCKNYLKQVSDKELKKPLSYFTGESAREATTKSE